MALDNSWTKDYEECSMRALMDATDKDEVLRRIEYFYGSEKNEQFRKLYDLLLTLPVEKNKNDFTLYIWVFERVGGTNITRLDDYKESEDSHRPEELYFDVYALDEFYDNDIVYSIVATRYKKFLGYCYSEYTYEKFSKESMLAHFLWELCRDDFNENRAL